MARPPPSSSGPPQARNGPLSSRLDVRGLADTATLRATVVRLAAAVRCSGVTTAAVNACRAGTSILESEWRTDSRAAVTAEARGDGHGQEKQVGDEVRHEHRLQEAAAAGDRGSQCLAERRQQVRGEEQQAQLGSGGAVPLLEPEGQDGLHGQPAGEGVDREQRRQAERGPAAGPVAESLLVRRRAHRYGAARLGGRGRAGGRGRRSARRAGVDRERRVAGLDVGEQRQPGRGEAAERPRQQRGHVVAGEECGVALVRARLGEDRLLDPAERGVVVGRRRDRADERRGEQQRIGLGDGEDRPRAGPSARPRAAASGDGRSGRRRRP